MPKTGPIILDWRLIFRSMRLRHSRFYREEVTPLEFSDRVPVLPIRQPNHPRPRIIRLFHDRLTNNQPVYPEGANVLSPISAQLLFPFFGVCGHPRAQSRHPAKMLHVRHRLTAIDQTGHERPVRFGELHRSRQAGLWSAPEIADRAKTPTT